MNSIHRNGMAGHTKTNTMCGKSNTKTQQDKQQEDGATWLGLVDGSFNQNHAWLAERYLIATAKKCYVEALFFPFV